MNDLRYYAVGEEDRYNCAWQQGDGVRLRSGLNAAMTAEVRRQLQQAGAALPQSWQLEQNPQVVLSRDQVMDLLLAWSMAESLLLRLEGVLQGLEGQDGG